HDTWARAAEYFEFHLHHYHVATTYFGTTWELAPWHYAPNMTAMTTPPVLLALATYAIVAILWRWAFNRPVHDAADEPARWKEAALLLLMFGYGINLLPSMLPWAPKYGGVRLFLPMFPYLAVMAGVGFFWLSQRIIERGKDNWGAEFANFPIKLRVGLAVLVVLTLVVAIGNSHPFGMSYYNSLIGGPSGAYELGMEPTYWGDTYLAAVGWLNREAEHGAKVWINVVGFASSVELYKPFGMLRDDLQITA
ncbi:unnamed protein product, partial [marine sediment metagenome]